MDIKTRLEDVEFLFSTTLPNKKIACTNMLKYLNSKGIYTVEDMINCQESDFSNSRRKTYVAVVQILKHAFMGQELVSDVLLEKTYTNNNKGIYECAKDFIALGFPIHKGPMYKSVLEKMVSNIIREFQKEDFKDEEFTMESIISRFGINASGPNLAQYYLDYLSAKKEKQTEVTSETIPSILDGLKTQLQGLITMRDGIDKQIQAVQEQIKLASEGEKSHGRK